jgi:hypothetical protein
LGRTAWVPPARTDWLPLPLPLLPLHPCPAKCAGVGAKKLPIPVKDLPPILTAGEAADVSGVFREAAAMVPRREGAAGVDGDMPRAAAAWSGVRVDCGELNAIAMS